jgi:hypothetical protein
MIVLGNIAAARVHVVVAPAAQARPSAQDIGAQIRQSIEEAKQQARDAAQSARDAQQHLRETQQQVRDAQRQLAAAHSDQATREAQTALQNAEGAQHEAQMELQGLGGRPVVLHTDQIPADMRDMIPPQAVDISIAFFVMCAMIIIGWPLARAFGKRIERRSEGAAALEPGLSSQLQRIEQAVDAMSIEIERISESQRFMAKLQSDSAQRVVMPSAERR